MKYRINPKNGENISQLAFGCMRFHRDEGEVERQIRYAIEQGVNYFDTAYIYGSSEATLGKILAKDNMRRRVNIATKLPYYLVRKTEDLDRYFNTQLQRLQTDYVDYYLMHQLPTKVSWQKLKELGVEKWIAKKKESGQIRQLGFSFHGTRQDFIDIIDDYDWDFCMIQYNYYDEQHQAGKSGLEYAGEKGIPVMIMEPLRGGTLVNKLPPEAKALWEKAPGDRSPAEWGLRWVWNHPQVLTVLSGMNSLEMVEENIITASEIEAGTLTDQELELYSRVRQAIQAATKVPCTGCGYCMPCPQGVDIPMCFNSLNDTAINGKWRSLYWYAATTQGHNASRCVQCGKCEAHCPQSIPIREKLSQVTREVERFPYKPFQFVVSRLLKQKE